MKIKGAFSIGCALYLYEKIMEISIGGTTIVSVWWLFVFFYIYKYGGYLCSSIYINKVALVCRAVSLFSFLFFFTKQAFKCKSALFCVFNCLFLLKISR